VFWKRMFGDKSALRKAQEASGEQESGFFSQTSQRSGKRPNRIWWAKVEQITSGREGG